MNEEDILILESNGYNVDEHGIIRDKEGGFLESVSLFGEDYSSGVSEQDHNVFLENEKIYQDSENERLAKEKEDKSILESYDKDPLSHANIDSVSESSYNSFFQDKVDNNLPGAFKYKEDFVEEKENEAISKDIKNKEKTGSDLSTKTVFNILGKDDFWKDAGINYGILEEVAQSDKRIKDIESKDPDVDTILGGVLKEKREDKSLFTLL